MLRHIRTSEDVLDPRQQESIDPGQLHAKPREGANDDELDVEGARLRQRDTQAGRGGPRIIDRLERHLVRARADRKNEKGVVEQEAEEAPEHQRLVLRQAARFPHEQQGTDQSKQVRHEGRIDHALVDERELVAKAVHVGKPGDDRHRHGDRDDDHHGKGLPRKTLQRPLLPGLADVLPEQVPRLGRVARGVGIRQGPICLLRRAGRDHRARGGMQRAVVRSGDRSCAQRVERHKCRARKRIPEHVVDRLRHGFLNGSRACGLKPLRLPTRKDGPFGIGINAEREACALLAFVLARQMARRIDAPSAQAPG
eukprot:scaffold2893_cov254-Pinguiococcus_pyrenoidosus.AAC.24